MKLDRVALAGLVLAVAGCKTVVSVQPAEFIPQHSPEVVWVTYTDNSYVPVAKPRIVGDSLQGTWVGLQEPVSISLKEIQTVQAKVPSPKRTIILFTTIGVATAAVAYTMATAGSSGPSGCLDHNGDPTNFCGGGQ